MGTKTKTPIEFYDVAKERLNYDPETGIFTWKEYRAPAAIKGGIAGTTDPRGYRCTQITIGNRFRIIRNNRAAWYFTYGELSPTSHIDHINGIKDDDRIINLRQCTASQNLMNSKPKTSNGVKGVYKVYHDKWVAKIVFQYKNIHLGTFLLFEDAVKARIEAEVKYFGEYAYKKL